MKWDDELGYPIIVPTKLAGGEGEKALGESSGAGMDLGKSLEAGAGVLQVKLSDHPAGGCIHQE